jgi:hypothetical protein
VIYLGFERLRLRMRAGFAGTPPTTGSLNAGATP